MNNQTIKVEDDAKTMPPPPFPHPILLDQEVESLKRCLQNAMLKTGQIYAFYGDARRLGIARYASAPPPALTSSLGHELEKYDQLCDAIECHLLRAIAVLQRDLRREEKRQEAIRLEAEEEMKSEEVLEETQPTEDFQFIEPAPPSTTEFLSTNPRNSPTHPAAGPINARRPSAISISSLQRPLVPPKLDLSSSSMRITSEDGSGMYSSGLASPVTLAPKSARPIGPNEFPDDFMTAFTAPVDPPVIDLTLTGNNERHQVKTGIDPTAGDSCDKPIELDLDMDMSMGMDDLFGDGPDVSSRNSLPTGVDSMFTIPGTGVSDHKAAKPTDFMDLNPHDIFTSLSNHSMDATLDLRDPSSSTAAGAPSPATLLATGFPQHVNNSNHLEHATNLPGADQFDMAGLGDLGDLAEFDHTSGFSLSDINAFLDMGSGGTGSGTARGSNTDGAKGSTPAEQSSVP